MDDWVQMKGYYTLHIFKFTFSSLNLLLNKVTVSNSITQWPSAFWGKTGSDIGKRLFLMASNLLFARQAFCFFFFFGLPQMTLQRSQTNITLYIVSSSSHFNQVWFRLLCLFKCIFNFLLWTASAMEIPSVHIFVVPFPVALHKKAKHFKLSISTDSMFV